jgi:DNA-binding IclR family transcriptional regulator
MRSLDRALAVFDSFMGDRSSLSLQEIADSIGLAKSTTFRLVHALEESGYLVRLDEHSYCLSFKFTRFSRHVCTTLDVREVARTEMEKLADNTRECVTLNKIVGRNRVCIEVANRRALLTSSSQAGSHTPLGLGGASLVLMAALDDGQLFKVLPMAARNAKCTKRELKSIIDTTRRQGYSVSHGGGIPGLTGISVPIQLADCQSPHCITVVVPTRRVGGRVPELLDNARRATVTIATRLGTL